jgi:hypothetical protein
MKRIRAIAALALVAGVIAGCGDDEDETTVTESVPPVSETAPPPAGIDETTSTSTSSGGVNPDEEDSETNDLPPEPGSAAERFEQRCEKKPESCD